MYFQNVLKKIIYISCYLVTFEKFVNDGLGLICYTFGFFFFKLHYTFKWKRIVNYCLKWQNIPHLCFWLKKCNQILISFALMYVYEIGVLKLVAIKTNWTWRMKATAWDFQYRYEFTCLSKMLNWILMMKSFLKKKS